MKKLFKIAIIIIIALCALMSLVACDNPDNNVEEKHEHTLAYISAVSATCDKAGNIEYWSCSGCGKNFSDENATKQTTNITIPAEHIGGTEIRNVKPATQTEEGYTGDIYCLGCNQKISNGSTISKLENHTHTTIKVERVEPTCKTNGHIEYWECTDCKGKFLDSKATSVIEDYILQAKHVGGTEIKGAKAPTESDNGYTGDTYCLSCGDKLETGIVLDKLDHAHVMQKTDKIDETCSTDGSIEYYTCSKCSKHFKDSDGIYEVELADIVIKATHKLTRHSAVAETCTENGSIQYWSCSVCNNNYSDELAEHKVDNIIVEKLNHNYQKPTWTWTGYESATVKLTCAHNSEHVITENATITNQITKTSNCVDTGTRTYTAKAKLNGNDYSDTKAETIPVQGHNYVNKICTVCGVKNYTYTGKCGDNLSWGLYYNDENKTKFSLDIWGNGEMYDYSSSTTPWSSYNSKITNICVENGATSISKGAFTGCNSLESITIPFVGASLNETKNEHFGYIFGADSWGSNWEYTPTSLKAVIITGCQSIGDFAFYNCSSLQSITIPNGVTSIGRNAFSDCASLQSITIPDSVTSIGYGAFWDCTSLQSITIPNSVTSIDEDAFINCDNLQYNEYGNAKYLGNNENQYLILVKANNSSITSCQINSKTKIIYYSAFKNCTKLQSITIPNSVTSIDEDAFWDCTSLQSITIGSGVTSIGQDAFQGCSSLESITIPDSVTSIGNSAFISCGKLQSVTIGSGVTSMGEGAFSWCGSLQSVTMGNGVTSIGRQAFAYCIKLQSITIPDSVTSIGVMAFAGCGLQGITVGSGNTKYHSVGNCLIEIASKTLIAGCGNSVIPTDGSVTSIGQDAFSFRYSLQSITIPDSVTSIGQDAFHGCTNLQSITIPDSVTSIGKSAFYECTSLKSLTIGNGVTSIGESAFYECTSLKSLTIPDSVTSIDKDAFCECTGLQSITIGSGVTSIGGRAFIGCKSLTSVTFADTSTWYYTTDSNHKYTGGTQISVTSPSDNAHNIRTFSYWYKI